MHTWQHLAIVSSSVIGILASAGGITTAAAVSRTALRHRKAESAAVQELSVALPQAVLDLRRTMAERDVDVAELARIEGVLSAGGELARAESTEEIVAQTDRLRDLVQHLQTAADQPPKRPNPPTD